MKKLLNIKSSNPDVLRRGRVFLIILAGLIFLTFVGLVINFSTLIAYLPFRDYSLNEIKSFILPLLIFLILINLFVSTKRGVYYPAAKVLVVMFLVLSVFMAFTWGADLPQALLMYSITIILAGILLSSSFGFLITIIVVVAQLTISYVQIDQIVQIDAYWKTGFIDFRDTLVTSITLTIIAIVSWLSNREIEKSLNRAERSEKALRKERDLLEVRVEERTRELQKAQLEKMLNLYRFADFGRLAAGLIHDLVNPLTAISLNLENVNSKTKPDILDESIQHALEGTQRLENYVEAARKQIQKQDIATSFTLLTEIEQVLRLFSYRLKYEHINTTTNCPPELSLHGNPIKFNQCLSNLIANALDALKTSSRKDKHIAITAAQQPKHIILTIHDNGPGIPSKQLPHIFTPFFTTKTKTGTGIGLTITKDIVEDTFKGSIHADSSFTKGTTFTLTFPTASPFSKVS